MLGFYQQMCLSLTAVNAELMAEELIVSTDLLYESLENRGLIQEGQLAYVTEDGNVGFGNLTEDEDDEAGERLTEEDLEIYLDAIVQMAMSQYEGADEEEVFGLLSQYIGELVDSGEIDAYADEPDPETDAQWVAKAKEMSLCDSFLDWLDDSDEGGEEEDEDD